MIFNRFIPKIGIDLGTTNVLVFVPGRGIVVNEPSVVAVSDKGEVMAVGEEAEQMIGRTPDDIFAYRPLRDGVIADYKVTEEMLRYFLQKSLSKLSLFKPDVMVSVPAGVTSAERRAVVEAVIKAGSKNAFVVKEPILAAVGAGIKIYEPSGSMVVDIGGGTIDVAVISLGGIVASNSVKCAGNKIDYTIVDFLKKNKGLSVGEKTAEELKIAIGSAKALSDELSMEVKGVDLISRLPRTVEVKTNEVVRAINKDLKRMVRAIIDVFQDIPPELASDIIDKGIIMTGGTSQLRNFPELIKQRTGIEAKLADKAMLCVANGTGVVLEHVDVYKKAVLAQK